MSHVEHDTLQQDYFEYASSYALSEARKAPLDPDAQSAVYIAKTLAEMTRVEGVPYPERNMRENVANWLIACAEHERIDLTDILQVATSLIERKFTTDNNQSEEDFNVAFVCKSAALMSLHHAMGTVPPADLSDPLEVAHFAKYMQSQGHVAGIFKSTPERHEDSFIAALEQQLSKLSLDVSKYPVVSTSDFLQLLVHIQQHNPLQLNDHKFITHALVDLKAQCLLQGDNGTSIRSVIGGSDLLDMMYRQLSGAGRAGDVRPNGDVVVKQPLLLLSNRGVESSGPVISDFKEYHLRLFLRALQEIEVNCVSPSPLNGNVRRDVKPGISPHPLDRAASFIASFRQHVTQGVLLKPGMSFTEIYPVELEKWEQKNLRSTQTVVVTNLPEHSLSSLFELSGNVNALKASVARNELLRFDTVHAAEQFITELNSSQAGDYRVEEIKASEYQLSHLMMESSPKWARLRFLPEEFNINTTHMTAHQSLQTFKHAINDLGLHMPEDLASGVAEVLGQHKGHVRLSDVVSLALHGMNDDLRRAVQTEMSTGMPQKQSFRSEPLAEYDVHAQVNEKQNPSWRR